MAIKQCHRFVLCCLLTSFVVVAQPAPPKDIDGWSKAKWGMSEQEIQAAFAPDVSKLPQSIKYDERRFDLVLSDFKAGQIVFTVRFLMDGKSNRLAGVSMKSEESKLSPDLFWALEKDMTQKYGPPTQRFKGSKLVTTWNFPTSTIQMLYGDSPLAGRFIYVNYDSNAAMPNSKP